MSYGEKYFTNFFDDDENKYRLQIFQWGFTGNPSSNLTLADNAVTINYAQDDDYFQPIIGSTCKLRIFVEEATGGAQWEDENTNWNLADFVWERSEFDFLIPTDDREFKIKVLRRFASGESDTGASDEEQLKDTTASFTSTVKVGDLAVNTTTGEFANVVNIVSDTFIEVDESIFSTTVAQNYEIFRPFWSGFIMQDSYTLPIAPNPFAVEIYASDLLGTINGYDIDLTTERPESFDVIQNCLKNINLQSGDGTSGRSLEFGYKVLCRLNQYSSATPSGSSNANPFEQTYIRSIDGLEDENGNYLNCKYVLESILRMFNCRVFQHENTFTIIDNASLALTSFNDGGGSYSKEFKLYDKNGTADGTEAIASPVQDINSTQNDNTIQPLSNDLIKIIRKPAIRQRTQIRIKDTLKSQFTNGGIESGDSRISPYSFGFYIDNWTIADDAKCFAVNSSTADTSGGGTPVVYGITPYAGSRSAILIGSTSSDNVLLTSTTANVGSTIEPLKLSFANYASDPDNTGAINWFLKFRIQVTPTSGGDKYYDLDNQEWVSSASDGINTISGTVQDQWFLNEIELQPCPITGSVTFEVFESEETIYNNSSFRMYFDDFFLKGISDLEYYDTSTRIIDTSFTNNSGVLKSVENRFGMLNDTKYSNCLVDSAGNPITAYKSFDQSNGATLETLMNMQRLNEFALNNFRYEGTFRKIADSDGFTKPIDMLTLPKINFNTLADDNHQAIDNLEFNVSKNRYKLSTHIPTQSNLTAFGDISSLSSFYKFKPED
jgi:hypothetical protein